MTTLPLSSNISSYKGSSDEFSDANIQPVLAVVRKLQEKLETKECIVFPDNPEKRKASEHFKAFLDSIRFMEVVYCNNMLLTTISKLRHKSCDGLGSTSKIYELSYMRNCKIA